MCVCDRKRERERELNKEQCRGDTWRTCGMYDLGFSGRRVVSLAPQSLYSPGVDCCTHWARGLVGLLHSRYGEQKTLLALLAVESVLSYYSVRGHSVLPGLRTISTASTSPCWQTVVLRWYSMVMNGRGKPVGLDEAAPNCHFTTNPVWIIL